MFQLSKQLLRCQSYGSFLPHPFVFEGTRAFQMGITYLIIALLLSRILHFKVLDWLLRISFSIWIIVIVVIFQHELRSGLARLEVTTFIYNFIGWTGDQGPGGWNLWHGFASLQAPQWMPDCHWTWNGNWICILKAVSLSTGRCLRRCYRAFFCLVLRCMMEVVIRGERDVAAAMFVPFVWKSQCGENSGYSSSGCLRFKQYTDALIVLVSEQTGEISITFEGHFIPVHDEEHFMKHLNQILGPTKKRKWRKIGFNQKLLLKVAKHYWPFWHGFMSSGCSMVKLGVNIDHIATSTGKGRIWSWSIPGCSCCSKRGLSPCCPFGVKTAGATPGPWCRSFACKPSKTRLNLEMSINLVLWRWPWP